MTPTRMSNIKSIIKRRPRRGRPRHRPSLPCSLLSLSSYLLLALMGMASLTSAYDMEFDPQTAETLFFKQLEQVGQIYIDQSEPPTMAGMSLDRRQDSAASTSPSGATAMATSAPSSGSSDSAPQTTAVLSTETSALASTAISSSIGPSVTVVTTPLPSPFDTSLGSNFTTTACPNYFNNFLSNSTFRSCEPVSLLLQNSNSFFHAESSPILLSQTLDAACNAPLAICSPLMANIAAELIDDSNCGQDYQQENPLVTQAYAGLVAYEPLYRATCLRDSATNNYCFAEAITNASDPADAYPYYTALGLSLPASATPTCSQCLQQTMGIFAQYARSEAQPLAGTYLGCASQLDAGCGPGFVDTAVKVGSVSTTSAAARKSTPAAPTWLVALLSLLTSFVVLLPGWA